MLSGRISWYSIYFDLDLDVDSTGIQLDILSHTPTPSVSVKSYHVCFFPGEPHFCRCLLSVSLRFGRPGPFFFCILVPVSTVLAVVRAGDPYAEHIRASKVVFFSVVMLDFIP